MQIASIVLEYLRVLLSWPVIAGLVALYFLIQFRDPLSDFLKRMVRGQIGAVTLEAARPSEQSKEIKMTEAPKTQDEIEKYISENPQQVIKEYIRTFNAYWFEKAFNLIYGTQISLLEHLLSKGTDGDAYINLYSFYQEFLNRSNLTATQFADYVGFLRDAKFVEIETVANDMRGKITPYGTDFLSYIQVQYKYSYKLKAF